MRYVIIEETDDYIICHGIDNDYHKAVGKLVCKSSDNADNWINRNGYAMKDHTEFGELECENGYVWSYTFINEECNITIHENWYLLECEDDEVSDGDK